jgi:DNA-binding transcriptional MerR regulator
MQTYKIGELSKIVNLTPRTIRYYEEIGLLNSVKKVESGRRIYTNEDIRRLKFIKRLKVLGLSLKEMEELESIYQINRSNEDALKKLLELLKKHLHNIDSRIEHLKKLKKEIVNYSERIEEKLNRE